MFIDKEENDATLDDEVDDSDQFGRLGFRFIVMEYWLNEDLIKPVESKPSIVQLNWSTGYSGYIKFTLGEITRFLNWDSVIVTLVDSFKVWTAAVKDKVPDSLQ